MTASHIRADLLDKRSSLPEDLVTDSSNRAREKVLSLSVYRNSQVVGSYFGVQGEIDPSPLADTPGPKHAFPVIKTDGKLSYLIPEDSFQIGPFGIPEPSSGLEVNPEELDLVLVPLVATDLSGNRIGHGAGFYDKTFFFRKQRKKPQLVGLAHEFQIVQSIDPNPWDIPLDILVTEKKIYQVGMNHLPPSMGED
ncbi:MAG TPA: 5-formyltetrahydrofolate cyclo-ligase [Acidimicrobiales bacterium]|nr:5-formyltetrahydrofolate cyclo-ligase [Acidimicrobiales bacterium]